MAHTQKFKASGAGQLGAHVDRTRGEEHAYANERIDPARTHDNYDLSGCNTPLSAIVADARAAAPKTVRKDAVMLGSTVTTLPSNWPDDRDSREFFEAVRAFDLAFWPESFIEARATVHMDESTPHMHHVFIPLDESGQPNWSATYTRRMYQRYHEEMSEFVRAATELPDLRILIPEEEAGEKQLSKLSQPDYIAARAAQAELDRQVDELEHRKERLRCEVEAMEPLAVTLSESARALYKARGDGEREAALGGEIERLRGRVSDCEGALRDCRERERLAVEQRIESEKRAAGYRGRIAVARERIAGLADRVTGTVYTGLALISTAVAEVLMGFGLDARVGEPPRPSASDIFAQALEAAEALARDGRQTYRGGPVR